MIRNENSPADSRSIQDKAYDLLGDLLIERDTARFMKELEDDEANGTTAEMDAFFAEHDSMYMRQIARFAKKERHRRFFKQTLPRIGQIASIVIAVISLTGSIAIAASPTIRVHVMQLLMQSDSEQTTLSLVENEAASFDVPADWTGRSYLSYVPDDLELAQVITIPYIIGGECHYIDKETGIRTLVFTEMDDSSALSFDTEGSDIREEMIAAYPGYVATSDRNISVFWSDGTSYYLVMTYGLSEDETLRIAQNVRIIQ